MRLLLVDDDEEFAAGLARFLARHDINTVLAGDAAAARQALSKAQFDVVVLDVMLPGESGFDFLPSLRAMSNVPVIMLTALSEEDERVTGLDLGADDYVTKPFSAKELVSRLRAAHRRYQLGQSNQEFVLDDLHLMPRQYRARVGGVDVPLTAAECRILQLLLQARDRAVPRETLYTEALFRDESPLDRSLDVHMSNLRRKLGPHPTKGTRIKAIRGRGYTLTA
ncbi:MAG: response regulator transcription factor [Pseudomonadota bacterium]